VKQNHKLHTDILARIWQIHQPHNHRVVAVCVSSVKTCDYCQVSEKSSVRSRRLQEALDHLHRHSAVIDELTDWLSDVHAKLLAANDMPAPTDVNVLKAVIRQHMVCDVHCWWNSDLLDIVIMSSCTWLEWSPTWKTWKFESCRGKVWGNMFLPEV